MRSSCCHSVAQKPEENTTITMPSLKGTEQTVAATLKKLQRATLEPSIDAGGHVKEEGCKSVLRGSFEERGLRGSFKVRDEGSSLLPEDVEDLVLARLPLSTLYKARPVCKRWLSLLMYPPFLKLRSEIRGMREAFFPLLFWRQDNVNDEAQRDDAHSELTTWSWLGFDIATSTWQGMKPFSTPSYVTKVVTGSKGLLCLQGDNCLLVCNPMTGLHREVPLKENVIQLVVDTERNAFQLICTASRKRTSIYDSQTGSWTKRGRPAPNLELSTFTGAFCDGVLYCVAKEERSGLWGVTGYDVDGSKTWDNVSLFPMRTGETCLKAKVVQYGGEVYSVIEKEVDEDDVGPRTKILSVWRLERTLMRWGLAGTMSTKFRTHLVNLDDYDCVALDDRICIFNKGTFKAVECYISYGVVTSWDYLPLDTHLATGSPMERIIVHFAFEPSLLTSV